MCCANLGSHPRGLRSPFQAAAFPIISIEPEFVVVAASEHVDLFVESPSHCDVFLFFVFLIVAATCFACVAACSHLLIGSVVSSSLSVCFHPSTHPPTQPSIHPFIQPSIHPSAFLSFSDVFSPLSCHLCSCRLNQLASIWLKNILQRLTS